MVEEIAHELAQLVLIWERRAGRRRDLRESPLELSVLVQQDANPAAGDLGDRRMVDRLERDDGEVDVRPVRVQRAALALPAHRRVLEEGQPHRPELPDPVLPLEQRRGVAGEDDDVEVRPFVGRNLDARLRADDRHGADVVLAFTPASEPELEIVHSSRAGRAVSDSGSTR